MDNDLRSTVVLPVALCIADLNAPLHRWWWHWILVLSRLQDIPSSDADVVEHCTHGNHLGCKSVLYFQDFEEDPSPQCLHHTKGPLNNDPGIDMTTKKCSPFRSSVTVMKSPLPFLGWVRAASLYLCLTQTALAMVLTNSTRLESILDKFRDQDEEWWRARPRGKRAISEGDMHLILDLHNKLRGQVHPPASNMEYMLVWATSNRIGCAINVCYNMNVWGMIWAKAVYLVCNYSPPGNWWGHAPYKYGTPCSACPASYAGGCRDNLCYKDGGVDRRPPPEIEENYIEPEPEPVRDREPQPRAQSPDPTPTDNREANQVVSTEQMCQQVDCETKLRDQCKGTTCNRYECPPGCLHRSGKVAGTGYYDMQSSVCGAGLHSGVIDDDGGWLDVTRLGRKQQFTKSYKNGIQSIGKNRSANSFKVESVPVKAVTCDTTVALFCPFKKPLRHCPRLYCPRNCLRDSRARVVGTKYYADKSSICRAAIHAGVIRGESGGYLDVMPVDRRRQYSGSYQNGISSESLLNPTGGKAFRVFAVI
ncbi:hypothetical protein F2P81_001027 [Scophthalmus maximus]|uniref:LCCL domain-containing protein n=1 Tax=Scophthalmus maximus TaxID=52904 RepID=A0A6A4TW70_SCOMX|nr:hypothetical protein F2P81_001027 [Scophthalmus maximus]